MASSKKKGCDWCLGAGLYKAYWDLGMRRPMEQGVRGKPRHPKEPVVPCDRCNLPVK